MKDLFLRDLFLLDPTVVFLNHGSFGACPRPVFESYQAAQRELERQPVEFLALERRLPELLEVPRRRRAAFLCAEPDCLALATNASSAVNAVARSLPLGLGDEILLAADEYPGMTALWSYVAERTGARVVRMPFDELDPGPRTKLVFVSHIEWTSGRVNDLAPVLAATRAAGARTPRGRSTCSSTRSAPTSTTATATSGYARQRAPVSSTRDRTRSI